MSLFNRRDLLKKFQSSVTFTSTIQESEYAKKMIKQYAKSFEHFKTYDIFLSHSYDDARIIKALRDELTEMKYEVYVDWIEDPVLNRERVSKHNAIVIKNRMRRCKCLFYATSDSAKKSIWMPWELGFMDSHTKRVAIVPILDLPSSRDQYIGREYLGIYPYIEKTLGTLYIHESEKKWVSFRSWLLGNKPKDH